MGLPEIKIEFVSKAVSAIQRSQLGIVALILKDDTQTAQTVTFKSVEEVKTTDWDATNFAYLQQTFMGVPSKVIVEVLPTVSTDYTDALDRLNNKRFNYLAIPGIDALDTTTVATWIKSKRDNDGKTFKAVLPNEDADHEGIINFTASDIVVGEDTFTASDYTARVAGVLAGLPFSRSATYYVFPEIDSVTAVADPDAAVEAGEFILIDDGEKVKVGRAVNSLTTTTGEKTEDFKSIRVVEVMDLIKDDIRTTFDNNYVGKLGNTYDNQVLFITAVNAYFDGLEGDEILDPSFDNVSFVDTAAQRLAWESIGTDTTTWDEQEVKEKSFKRKVFLAGNIKIVDAMEDLEFVISI